jgi:HMG (high mobility group) box
MHFIRWVVRGPSWSAMSTVHVKRPLNAFMVWSQQERRRMLTESSPLSSTDISRLIFFAIFAEFQVCFFSRTDNVIRGRTIEAANKNNSQISWHCTLFFVLLPRKMINKYGLNTCSWYEGASFFLPRSRSCIKMMRLRKSPAVLGDWQRQICLQSSWWTVEAVGGDREGILETKGCQVGKFLDSKKLKAVRWVNSWILKNLRLSGEEILEFWKLKSVRVENSWILENQGCQVGKFLISRN